jgi:ubiquinone/menaquinone biosynthesis C-methylase UbiE
MGPLAGRSVLDVGCGDGKLARLCASHGAAWVAGCDVDARMIARAKATDGTVELCVAEAERLPFVGSCFHIVTCVTVLAFVPNASTAVREMARVLRPGGRLVIGDLGKWSIWAARRRVRGWLGAQLWRAARFRTKDEIAALAREAGLTVQTAESAIFFPPWLSLARLIAPMDPTIGNLTGLGAAFIAVQAAKL